MLHPCDVFALVFACAALITTGCATAPAAGAPPAALATPAAPPPGDTPAPPACTAVVPADAEQLVIAGAGGGLVTGRDLAPGDTHELQLGFASSYAGFQKVPVCAEWRVEPSAEAVIDAGRLRVLPGARGPLRVTALLPNGVRIEDVFPVVADRLAALVGTWHETGRRACGGGAWTPPAHPIRELTFRSTGDFGVTWVPFETYVDYWGTYTFDPATSRLALTVTGGNFIPLDMPRAPQSQGGPAHFEGGALVLELSLGASGEDEARPCTHRFER